MCSLSRALTAPRNGQHRHGHSLRAGGARVVCIEQRLPIGGNSFKWHNPRCHVGRRGAGVFSSGPCRLASLVFITTVVGPFLQIASLLYLLIPLRCKQQAPGQSTIFRVLTQARPWTFVEVFML